ncbi:MAG: hypothetical protein WA184_24155, partial [Stellaceae bacterium]
MAKYSIYQNPKAGGGWRRQPVQNSQISAANGPRPRPSDDRSSANARRSNANDTDLAGGVAEPRGAAAGAARDDAAPERPMAADPPMAAGHCPMGMGQAAGRAADWLT